MCKYFSHSVQTHRSSPTGTVDLQTADLGCADYVPVLITCRETLSWGFLVSVSLVLALLPDSCEKIRLQHLLIYGLTGKKHLADLEQTREMHAATTCRHIFLMTACIFHASNRVGGFPVISGRSGIFYVDLSIIILIYRSQKQRALWDFCEVHARLGQPDKLSAHTCYTLYRLLLLFSSWNSKSAFSTLGDGRGSGYSIRST